MVFVAQLTKEIKQSPAENSDVKVEPQEDDGEGDSPVQVDVPIDAGKVVFSFVGYAAAIKEL